MGHVYRVGDKVVYSALPLEPSVEPSPSDTQPCCTEGKIEPDIPGMIYIPGGYVAWLTDDSCASGPVWVTPGAIVTISEGRP